MITDMYLFLVKKIFIFRIFLCTLYRSC